MRIISLVLLISGCSWFPNSYMEPTVITKIETVPIRIYQPPLPHEIKMIDLSFWVITEENYAEKRKEIEKILGGNFVVFALTPDGYEKMAENLQELRRYFRETKEIILYYKEATSYESQNKAEGRDSTDFNGSKPAP